MSTPPTAPRRTGPVVIGYDGSAVADRALAEAAGLLAPRTALVVTVWEAGRAFESAWPVSIEVPVPVVDIRVALEMEQAAYETAERTAMQGAARAMSMGLQAESLSSPTRRASPTPSSGWRRSGMPALVIGAHRHGALSEVLLGSTSRDIVRHAPCPAIVVREADDRRRESGS